MGLDSELIEAVEEGDVERVRGLLERGADPDARDEDGRTPLYIAAANGSVEVARLLLKHGADVNARAIDGSTPLHLAVAFGHLDVAELLLERGADVNAGNRGRPDPASPGGYHGPLRGR